MKIYVRSSLIFWAACILMAASGSASGESVEIPEVALFPTNLANIRISPPVDFCGEPVPLDDPDIREDLEKEMLLTIWNRPQFILYVKRSGRYMPYVEKMLRENNLPEDLKYVAIAESALLPHIGSSAGAVGYWQFIKWTGAKIRTPDRRGHRRTQEHLRIDPGRHQLFQEASRRLRVLDPGRRILQYGGGGAGQAHRRAGHPQLLPSLSAPGNPALRLQNPGHQADSLGSSQIWLQPHEG